VLGLDQTMQWIAEWYRCHRDGDDMVACSMRQLADYQSRVVS